MWHRGPVCSATRGYTQVLEKYQLYPEDVPLAAVGTRGNRSPLAGTCPRGVVRPPAQSRTGPAQASSAPALVPGPAPPCERAFPHLRPRPAQRPLGTIAPASICHPAGGGLLVLSPGVGAGAVQAAVSPLPRGSGSNTLGGCFGPGFSRFCARKRSQPEPVPTSFSRFLLGDFFPPQPSNLWCLSLRQRRVPASAGHCPPRRRFPAFPRSLSRAEAEVEASGSAGG